MNFFQIKYKLKETLFFLVCSIRSVFKQSTHNQMGKSTSKFNEKKKNNKRKKREINQIMKKKRSKKKLELRIFIL